MKIGVVVVADAEMGRSVLPFDAGRLHPRYRDLGIEWDIVLKPRLDPADLINSTEVPSTCLYPVWRAEDLCALRALEEKVRLPQYPEWEAMRRFTPVLAVLSSRQAWHDPGDLPWIVADWVYLEDGPDEISARMLRVLGRAGHLKSEVAFAGLSLVPHLRVAHYGNASVHLTPTETLLLELLIQRGRSVLTLDDLGALFRVRGLSASTTNIRVAIFKLRLKISDFTHGRIRLANVYGRGYCLHSQMH